MSGGDADGVVGCVCEVCAGGVGEGKERGDTGRGAGVFCEWRVVVEEKAGE